MKTKEEILAQQLDRYLLKISHVERGCTPIPVSIYRAMDQYSQQQAIAFAEWIDGNGFECELHTDENVKFWAVKDGSPYLTTDELYTLFLSQQKH